jgi:hypothetical protein
MTAQGRRDLTQEIRVLLDGFAVIIQDASQALDEAVSFCLVVYGRTLCLSNLPSVKIISRTRGAAGAAMLLLILGCAESIVTAGRSRARRHCDQSHFQTLCYFRARFDRAFRTCGGCERYVSRKRLSATAQAGSARRCGRANDERKQRRRQPCRYV